MPNTYQKNIIIGHNEEIWYQKHKILVLNIWRIGTPSASTFYSRKNNSRTIYFQDIRNLDTMSHTIRASLMKSEIFHGLIYVDEGHCKDTHAHTCIRRERERERNFRPLRRFLVHLCICHVNSTMINYCSECMIWTSILKLWRFNFL